MKKRITKSAIRNSYTGRIASVNYCRLQFLMRGQDPFAYSDRREGWACDYYEIPREICISTGYSPIGKRIDYEFLKYWDDAARRICEEENDWKKQKKRLEALRADFAGDLEARYFA